MPTAPILWLVRKDHSAFNDDHGREIVNVMLSGVVFGLLSAPIVVLGWIAFAAWMVAMIVNMIRAAIAAGNNEYFRYPMIIRFLK